LIPRPPTSTLFPYTTLFRSSPFKRELTVRDAKTIKGQYPLVLFSHGNGGSRLSMEWLAQSLVKSGYIVAAVDHWGNTHDNKIGIEFLKPRSEEHTSELQSREN